MLFELINKYHMYNGTSNTTTNNRVTMFLSFFGFCAKKEKEINLLRFDDI